MSAELEVKRLLKQHKGVLIRMKNHLVWKLDNGALFTQSCTPSDIHAEDNQLRDLRRILGLNGTRGVPGERREKHERQGRDRSGTKITPSANTAMLDALRKVALTEDVLNAKIATLTIELRDTRRANHRKRRALRQMHGHCEQCWGCRLRRWWMEWKER